MIVFPFIQVIVVFLTTTFGVSIIPVALGEGEVKIEAIKDFLAEKEVTENNGRLAIWLNNYPSSDNLDGIALNTSPIQFLIFKQAIDTGWDCPRAHILVKFRETKSETFEIQILGRILRMPEQKHYPIDALNDAYVYTNISDIKVAQEEYNPNIIKHIKMKRIDSYKLLSLPSYYKSRADYGDITSDFTEIFANEALKYFEIQSTDAEVNFKLLKSKGLDLEVDKLKDIVLTDSLVESALFDTLEGNLEGDSFAELSKSANDTQVEFNKFLERHMGTFTNVARSIPAMKSAMFSFFKKYLGALGKKDVSWLQKMVLATQNQPHFELLFTNAVAAFSTHRELEVKQRVEGGEQFPIFEVPEEIYINEFVEEIVTFNNNVMNPCYLQRQRSQVERNFEDRIDKDSTIEWWFKNGVNKVEFLGIKYEYPANRIKSFYPDYIIQFKDGSIGVFETKSKGDDENLGGFNGKTKAKAEALNRWKTNLPKDFSAVRAGIVIVDGKNMYFNDKATFNIEAAQKGDLSDWEVF